MNSRLMNLERIVAALFLVLGVAAVVDSRRLDYWAPYGPGAGFFPLWLGLALIGASVYLLAQGSDGPTFSLTPAMKRLLFFVGAFLLSVISLPYLGWFITFAVFACVVLRNISGVSLKSTIQVTIGLLLFTQIVFSYFLKIPLPKGILPF